jgi:hypothetical protein
MGPSLADLIIPKSEFGLSKIISSKVTENIGEQMSLAIEILYSFKAKKSCIMEQKCNCAR